TSVGRTSVWEVVRGWQDCFSPAAPDACPEAPSDRTTVRICHSRTQKKPDFSRAFLCRGGRIRTYDLHIPNVARYRATLHPDKVSPLILCGTNIRGYFLNPIP